MHTLLVTLHVVTAVFLIGPMAIAPMAGLRGIRQQDTATVRAAARQTMLFALLSLLVFAFGVAIVATGHEDYSFGTAWISISMTLYILALLITVLVVAPSLGQAVKLLGTGSTVDTGPGTGAAEVGKDVVDAVTPGSPEDQGSQDPGGSPPTAPLSGPGSTHPPKLAEDAVRKLDAVRGRVAATSGLSALLLLIITIMMVTRPFS